MLATGVFSSWAMFWVSCRFSLSCSCRVVCNRLYILMILSAISPTRRRGKSMRSSVSSDSLWSARLAKIPQFGDVRSQSAHESVEHHGKDDDGGDGEPDVVLVGLQRFGQIVVVGQGTAYDVSLRGENTWLSRNSRLSASYCFSTVEPSPVFSACCTSARLEWL